jgi:hypothetical protein
VNGIIGGPNWNPAIAGTVAFRHSASGQTSGRRPDVAAPIATFSNKVNAKSCIGAPIEDPATPLGTVT